MVTAVWGWREIQDRRLRAGDRDHATCPACGEQVLAAVGALHITEAHPEVATAVRRAARQEG